METFDSSEAIKAQSNLQKAKGYPAFAPSRGICYNCGKNIYEEINNGSYKSGISVERATNSLITGCPHCHRSYCD